jgi:uncharacterized membrane protein YgcG
MKSRRWLEPAVLLGLGILWLSPSVGVGQDRSLWWDALTVHARLDADGALHVSERHAMVFDGAWNGGERTFQLRPWQELRIAAFGEVDPTTQLRTSWREGDLDEIGEYERNGNVLRWRARLPNDPPFANIRKTYEINYSLTGLLIPENGVYRLEHDLAFPDRGGEIRVFEATLEVDPAWAAADLPTSWHHENLQPGESVFANASLRFVGTGQPVSIAAVRALPSTSAAPMLRYALFAIVLAFAIFHTVALLNRERARGRFAPPLPLEEIDDAWLQAHVFNQPPEVVGAAWDLDTSASEVSALLARLAQQGAIKTEVRKRGVGWFSRETLYMELLCERDRLADHERALIDSLFFSGSRSTDTDRIREHYSKSGFTPAALITSGIEKQLPVVFANKIAVPPWARWATGLLFAAGVIAFIVSVIQAPDAAPPVIVSGIILLACWVFALVFGYGYRSNVHGLRGRLTRALICSYLICAVVAIVLLARVVPMVPLGMVAVTLIALAFVNSAYNMMRTRETPAALQVRRQLGSARLYFEQELRSEQPRLKDEWFPYLLAFGLGPKIDRWFKSFGGTTPSTARAATAGSIVSHGGVSSRNGSSWTGGGGAFGGAGASASWAGAVSGIASGVAKPSSSSSGGRSSGGGSSRSSGGGGGGGW